MPQGQDKVTDNLNLLDLERCFNGSFCTNLKALLILSTINQTEVQIKKRVRAMERDKKVDVQR